MRPLKLGFIGLGIMGAPMAGQLVAAGHSLFVHTRCAMPAMQQALQDAAAVACTNATEVAQQADTTFLMLPDTPDVATVLFGESRVAAGLKAGRTVVDRSSLSPIETKQFAQRIDALDCQYMDAPVSGGEVGAKAASLTIMVVGPQAASDAALLLLQLMGKNITLVGAMATARPPRWPTRSGIAAERQRGPADAGLSGPGLGSAGPFGTGEIAGADGRASGG